MGAVYSFNNSVPTALCSLFPDIGLNKSLFYRGINNIIINIIINYSYYYYTLFILVSFFSFLLFSIRFFSLGDYNNPMNR